MNSVPSKYKPSSTLLDFSDRTRTGISKLISRCALYWLVYCLLYSISGGNRYTTEFYYGNFKRFFYGPRLPGNKDLSCAEHAGQMVSVIVEREGAMYTFNWHTYKWTRLQDVPEAKYSSGCAVIDGKELWVVGGSTKDTLEMSASVKIYDFATAIWRDGPDLPSPRTGHRCFAVGNKGVAVVGGLNGQKRFSDVLMYKADKKVWERIAARLEVTGRSYAVALVDKRSGAKCVAKDV